VRWSLSGTNLPGISRGTYKCNYYTSVIKYIANSIQDLKNFSTRIIIPERINKYGIDKKKMQKIDKDHTG